jgi:hypothetical protein
MSSPIIIIIIIIIIINININIQPYSSILKFVGLLMEKNHLQCNNKTLRVADINPLQAGDDTPQGAPSYQGRIHGNAGMT